MTTQSQDFSITPEKYLYRYINFLNLFKKCVNVCSDKIRQNNCPTDGRRWGLFQGYLFNLQQTLLAWMANCIGAENEPDCEGCHCQWDLVILSRYTDTNTECGGICPRPMAALLCTAYIYIYNMLYMLYMCPMPCRGSHHQLSERSSVARAGAYYADRVWLGLTHIRVLSICGR